ncbi:MAG: hypothetical protein ACUVQQ_02855, partial [Thermogutta sp.]
MRFPFPKHRSCSRTWDGRRPDRAAILQDRTTALAAAVGCGLALMLGWTVASRGWADQPGRHEPATPALLEIRVNAAQPLAASRSQSADLSAATAPANGSAALTIRDAAPAPLSSSSSPASWEVGEASLDLEAEELKAGTAELFEDESGPEVWVEDASALADLPRREAPPAGPVRAAASFPRIVTANQSQSLLRAEAESPGATSLPNPASVERLNLAGEGAPIILHLRPAENPTEKSAHAPFAAATPRPSRSESWMQETAAREAAMNRDAVRACLPWLSPTVMGNLRAESPGRVALPPSYAATMGRANPARSCLQAARDRTWLAEPAAEENVIRDRQLRLVAGQQQAGGEGVAEAANGAEGSRSLVQTGLDWPAADTRHMGTATGVRSGLREDAAIGVPAAAVAPLRESSVELKVLPPQSPVATGPVDIPVDPGTSPRPFTASSQGTPQRNNVPGNRQISLPSVSTGGEAAGARRSEDLVRQPSRGLIATESNPTESNPLPAGQSQGMKVMEFSASQSPAPRDAVPLRENASFGELRLAEDATGDVPGDALVEDAPTGEAEMGFAAPFEIIEESGELTVIVRRS